jgi:hypothetical protein
MRKLLSAAGYAEISTDDNKDNYLASARKPQEQAKPSSRR